MQLGDIAVQCLQPGLRLLKLPLETIQTGHFHAEHFHLLGFGFLAFQTYHSRLFHKTVKQFVL